MPNLVGKLKYSLANKDDENIDMGKFLTKLTTERTSAIKTALEGKANASGPN